MNGGIDMKRRLLLFSATLLSLTAQAYTWPLSPVFSVTPANPTVIDEITLSRVAPLDGCEGGGPQRVRVSMSGNNIDITYLNTSAECSGPLFDWGPNPTCIECIRAYRIGPLPAGTYTLRIVTEQGQLIGSQPLTVAPVESLTDGVYPRFNYADTYYSPSQSGWGLHLLQTQSRQLAGALYVYNQSGQPVWYLIGPGIWATPTRYVTKAFKTTGTFFGDATFQGGPQQEVGTVTLDFHGWNNSDQQLSVSYVIEGESKTIELMRQRF
jgi:hypothetical protein